MLRKYPTPLVWLASLCILVCLCASLVSPVTTSAQGIASFSYRRKVSTDLFEKVNSKTASSDMVRVVVQLKASPNLAFNSMLTRSGISQKVEFANFNTRVVEMPASAVKEMANYNEVSYVSLDRDVELLGHVETTTGAAAMRQVMGNSNLDGTGVGIAIIDSGIYRDHHSFSDRILAAVDFTGENKTDKDPYGHGTHVAAMAAASKHVTNGAFSGVATNAKLINLRVLDSQGRGSVSRLLTALDWVMSNRARYNIRVVNLSLGTLAVDSYVNDPLCRAVRRLVDAGVVVVAAAGNNGKNSDGEKVYGQIHSPGNEPSAITVGAVNTYGTDVRSDDTIASYSSRGPTRSYAVDSANVKHYDNVIKPDLVAPGNKLVGAAAKDNELMEIEPALDANVSNDDHHEEMVLSGTSMATPIVSGAAALLLQANYRLTPNMVKMILMYTAQPLAGANMLEQGAGELNIEGAVRLAKLVRLDLTNNTPLGAPFLTTSTAPLSRTTIAGQTFNWGQGIILDQTFVTGTNLITRYQKIYGTGMLLGDATVVTADGRLLTDGVLLGDGMLLGDNVLTSNGMLLGDGTPFLACGMLLGDGMLMGDGMLLGDGRLLGDGMLLGDGVLLGDAQLQALSSMLGGDNTATMAIPHEDGSQP